MLRLGRTLGAAACWAVWLGWTTSAHAEPTGTPEDLRRHASDTVTQYAFDDQLVDGDDVNPTLEVLHVRKQRRGESLVRARSAFVDRVLKSIEDL
jgi:hypothetical protein